MPIPVEAIIDKIWADDLSSRSGEDRIINYAMPLRGQFAQNNYGVSTSESTGIRSIFTELDGLLGVSFAETTTEDADIILYSVKKHKSFASGETVDNGQQYVVTWTDVGGKRLTSGEISTIRHEIGHCLGLDHPYGDGMYKGATTKDTIMSYFEVVPKVTNYSALDIQALQLLWGLQA